MEVMTKIKILIIDDEIDDLINTQKLFIKAGYDVQISNSGEQGLEYLKTFKVDAVLCDVVMQHMPD
jgi:CheY-like chemotaxis protein